MKIRNGFVSNSSSSSFIVAQKEENELFIKIKVPSKSCKVYRDAESLAKEHYYETVDELMENCQEFREAIKVFEEGKVIKIFKVSSEGYTELDGLHGATLKKDMVPDGVEIINNGEC